MIEAAGLTKRYGAAVAVQDLSFTISPGQVTGFLGPNGAGKSTTMRLILGLDAPDCGTVTVGGRPYASYRRPLSRAGGAAGGQGVPRRPDSAQPPAVPGGQQRDLPRPGGGGPAPDRPGGRGPPPGRRV